jgi:hypothetical protein
MYTPLRAGRETNSFVRANPNENMFKIGLGYNPSKDIFVKNEPRHHKVINTLEKSKQVVTRGRVN